VNWTNLLANNEAQKHKTSKKELDNMRALIARDLADAGISGLSADRRFATAYNAALQAASMAIACAGYRIVSKVGHHRVSLESTKLVLGKAAHKYADYFETCRRKRNTSTTLSPTLRPRQKQKRSSFKQNSFTSKSKTGLRKTIPH
jgi:N-acyl-D-aspartate/D-glutamate deacylase